MAQRPNTQAEEDNLTRFRLVHPDKDVRALSKRLHRLPQLPRSTDEEQAALEAEKGVLELEMMKFAAGVERTVRGANKLSKQREHYLRLKSANEERAATLSVEVAKEKEILAKRRTELAHAVQCDALAQVIRARTQSRQDLDKQIADLQASVASHRATHTSYLATAQSRVEAMANITNLIQEAQAFTLVADPDTQAPPSAVTTGSELSAAAPAFRPKRAADEGDAEDATSSSTRSKKRKPTPDGPRRLPARPRGRTKMTEKEDGEHSS